MLNDLWRYNITTDTWTWIRGSSINNQPGFYGTQGVQNINNRPGGRHLHAGWSDASSNLYIFGGDGYAASATNPGPLNDLWKYNNCLIAPITMTIIAKDSVLCAGESTSLTASGSNNYLWSLNSYTTADIVIKPGGTTTYTVFTNGPNNCQYSASFTESVLPCAGLSSIAGKKDLTFYPNPNHGSFKILNASHTEHELFIYNATGACVYHERIREPEMPVQTFLPDGIYFYKSLVEGEISQTGKLLINR
jgi:hypothetical protein